MLYRLDELQLKADQPKAEPGKQFNEQVDFLAQ
jgi:hypothetical protein